MAVSLLLALSLVPLAVSHPQCLDFRPPFTTSGSGLFCSQYAEFGCCTRDDHRRLEERFAQVERMLPSQWDTCGEFVRELMCQKCSPYAAHIYDAEATQSPRKFPGLCRSYCRSVYDSCRDVIQFIDSDLPDSPSFSQREDFCRMVSIPSDNDYCFPELLDNPIFQEQLNNTQITGEGCLCLEAEVADMRNPIVAVHAGDGSGRLFIGEQLGFVHIYYPRNKTGLHTPYLNITSRVKSSSSRGDERGFFSIVFHPQYSENGRFFVYYSTFLEDGDPDWIYGEDIDIDHKIRISEFRVSENNPNAADLNSENIILEVMEPFWNHNGGELKFGDDGYLYIFVGDGGAGGDPHNFAQNKSVHLGKILRLDVDSPSDGPYSIPPDNPFLDEPDTKPEIFAYGVRNIWRCGKDRGDRATGEGRGRILCGDVGQSSFEELNLVKKGANYGWRAREGFQCYDEDMCGEIGEEELPVYAYPHSQGKSITGGVFYRGCESPALNGQYIYADYMNGKMFSIVQVSPIEWKNKEVVMCGSDLCLNGLIGQYARYVISFGEDEEGEIYMLSTGSESATERAGAVYKIVDPARRGDPSECQHAHNGDRVDIDGYTRASNNVNSASNVRVRYARTCAMAVTLMCVVMAVRH